MFLRTSKPSHSIIILVIIKIEQSVMRSSFTCYWQKVRLSIMQGGIRQFHYTFPNYIKCHSKFFLLFYLENESKNFF